MLATAAPSAPPPAVTGGAVPNAGVDDAPAGLLSLQKLQRQFNDYLGDKIEEVEEAKVARRMYHGQQWTAEQIRVLAGRGQPPHWYNRIARKVDGIVGIAEKQRQDPKAYPRNPQDEDGADVATTVVRYVMERNEWTSKKPHALRQALMVGISGVEFRLVDGDRGDPDIEIHAVAMEDFFYDSAAIHPNFTDARYMGLSKWMDVEEAVEMFRDKEEEIRSLLGSGAEYTIDSDRDNRWTRRTENRLRLVEHWYVSRGEWCWAFYIGSTILGEGASPFFDERGKTACRFQMFSCSIDQDGDRYGIIRNLKPIQDEINQRVSALLRLAVTRRVMSEKGAVDDVERARKEWAKPDGWVEFNVGKKMQPDDTSQQVGEHTALLQMAMNEMEAFYNINPAALAGGTHNLSGRAVNALQAPGLAELVMFLDNYRHWIIRCYRMAWNLSQRFWTAERWIRVTDNQQVAQFVQLNGLKLDDHGLPMIVNAVGALDVDIVLEEGPDVQNSMQDAFDQLVQIMPLLQPGSVPNDLIFSLMSLPADAKKQIKAHAQQAAQPDPAKEQAKKIALESEAAKTAKTQAETQKIQADTGKAVADTGKSHADALSALGSTAHKLHEAHLNSARVVAGGLAQIEGTPQHAAATAALQGQGGPMQADVPPAQNAPPTALGPRLPMVPGASPGANAALAGQPPAPPPVGQEVPGIAPGPALVAPALHIHSHQHHAPHGGGLLAGLGSVKPL